MSTGVQLQASLRRREHPILRGQVKSSSQKLSLHPSGSARPPGHFESHSAASLGRTGVMMCGFYRCEESSSSAAWKYRLAGLIALPFFQGQPPPSWRQGFFFNSKPGLQFGLVQLQGGPCGVIAAVQAHVLAALTPEVSSLRGGGPLLPPLILPQSTGKILIPHSREPPSHRLEREGMAGPRSS